MSLSGPTGSLGELERDFGQGTAGTGHRECQRAGLDGTLGRNCSLRGWGAPPEQLLHLWMVFKVPSIPNHPRILD